MKPNRSYQLIDFNPNCLANYKNKLIALGLIPGKIFTIIRQAPFGGPIEIKIDRTHLALRASETKMLLCKQI